MSRHYLPAWRAQSSQEYRRPSTNRGNMLPGMKLLQNQVWKQGDEFLRIVVLERLAVRYKAMKDLATGEGKHHSVTKKEFCRLIKGATLLTPSDGIGKKAGDQPAA
jgi:hypothetical protein